MTRESALEIAKDFVDGANSCGWDGKGKPPKEFLEDNALIENGIISGGAFWDWYLIDDIGIMEIEYDNDLSDEDQEWYFVARYGLKKDDPNHTMVTCFNLNDINEIANTILEAQLEYYEYYEYL